MGHPRPFVLLSLLHTAVRLDHVVARSYKGAFGSIGWRTRSVNTPMGSHSLYCKCSDTATDGKRLVLDLGRVCYPTSLGVAVLFPVRFTPPRYIPCAETSSFLSFPSGSGVVRIVPLLFCPEVAYGCCCPWQYLKSLKSPVLHDLDEFKHGHGEGRA